MAKEVVEGEGRINFNLLVCVHKNTWICYYQKKTDSRNEGVKGSQGCALAEPGGPCLPTFALGRLENLRLFIQIICWHPGFYWSRVLGCIQFSLEHSIGKRLKEN